MPRDQPESRRIYNELLVDLDEVQLGRVVRVAVAEIARQTSHQNLASIAERFVKEAITYWDPPGPHLTDKAAQKFAAKIAPPAVHDMVLGFLKELDE